MRVETIKSMRFLAFQWHGQTCRISCRSVDRSLNSLLDLENKTQAYIPCRKTRWIIANHTNLLPKVIISVQKESRTIPNSSNWQKQIFKIIQTYNAAFLHHFSTTSKTKSVILHKINRKWKDNMSTLMDFKCSEW